MNGINGSTNGSTPHPLEGPKVFPDLLSAIGHTPLIKLTRIPQAEGIKCDVYAKCEFFNPGGSHKDRIALRMIEEAERTGRLKPGSTIIEPTSGNTGVGVALVAACKGYKCILVMPDKMSSEKMNTMHALGAQIVRTPNCPVDSPSSHVNVALRLNKEIPNSIVLDQYKNSWNANAHYQDTAEEILEQCGGHLDMVVIGVGTGGAISGIGRKMKEKCKECRVIGVDPEGSIMAEPASLNASTLGKPFEVEGIGHDWMPEALDSTVVDQWYKCSDYATFQMARRIISEEGMLVGGSTGSVLHCGLQAIKESGLKKGQRAVLLFPDSIRNYIMTKFATDHWMLERNFMSHEPMRAMYNWWDLPIEKSGIINKGVFTFDPQTCVKKAMKVMQEKGLAFIPILEKTGAIQGVLTNKVLFSHLTLMDFNAPTNVSQVSSRQYKKVPHGITLGQIVQVFRGDADFVLVIEPTLTSDPSGKKIKGEKLIGTIHQEDLMKLITENLAKNGPTPIKNGQENGTPIKNGVQNGIQNGQKGQDVQPLKLRANKI